jgi:hypothetical protein
MLSDKEIADYIQNLSIASLKPANEREKKADEMENVVTRKAIIQVLTSQGDGKPDVLKDEDVHDIRIVRANTDKTRKMAGAETVYHVCFVLSASPAVTWRSAFGEEWKALGKARPELQRSASIDGGFLFVECHLQEVAATILPALKQAVAAANTSYKGYVEREEREQTRREDVWKDERKSVEDMARSLNFD